MKPSVTHAVPMCVCVLPALRCPPDKSTQRELESKLSQEVHDAAARASTSGEAGENSWLVSAGLRAQHALLAVVCFMPFCPARLCAIVLYPSTL